MKGHYHKVAPGETLVFLAEWYYGGGHLWEVIYYENEELIGDDPETVEPGTKLFIPALLAEDATLYISYGYRHGSARRKYRTKPEEIKRERVADTPIFHAQPQAFAGTEWRLELNEEIELRSGGLESAGTDSAARSSGGNNKVRRTGVRRYVAFRYQGIPASKYYRDEPGMVPGKPGYKLSEDVQLEVIEVDAGLSTVAGEATVDPPPYADKLITGNSGGYAENALRRMVEEYYGHNYYYFAVLRANGLTGAEALPSRYPVVFTGNGHGARLSDAEYWRDFFGE